MKKKNTGVTPSSAAELLQVMSRTVRHVNHVLTANLLMFRLVSEVKLESTCIRTWEQLTAELDSVNSGYCPFWPKDAILFIHR